MKYMENNLDMPVGELLKIMQDRILSGTAYFGIPAVKSPLDFWVYQEIIYQVKPDVIIELGNHCGGSTLALAHILDNMNRGKVVGVDIDHKKIPSIVRKHTRITLITGDACKSFEKVKNLIQEKDIVLVIEDSSHTYENTLNVLRTYNSLIRQGSYFIVEDGICHHGLDVGPDPGPYEAVEQFINENKNFKIDRAREAFFITWNPKGFLKRI
ncbi:MAG: cephalosporin hydroxylase family protein [Firmicutes bacterium]|nr:cephalosporin hydroxylase family protein [Bacillota bacterium]